MIAEVFSDGSPASASTLRWLRDHHIQYSVRNAEAYKDFLGERLHRKQRPVVIVYTDQGHHVITLSGYSPRLLAHYFLKSSQEKSIPL